MRRRLATLLLLLLPTGDAPAPPLPSHPSAPPLPWHARHGWATDAE